MSSVKQSETRILRSGAAFVAAAALLGVQGCESGDLARFAPPGIIKYEEIASEKPPNPEVVKRVAERRAAVGGGEFPILSQTPGPNARPEKRAAAELEAEMAALTSARDDLSSAVDADWAAAEAELEADLPAARDALKQQVDGDVNAAAHERRKAIPSQPDEK